MGRTDELLATIGTIHQAGLNDELWPDALARLTRLFGAVGATFEVLDKTANSHRQFHSFAVPPPQQIEYLDHYLTLSPRIRSGLRTSAGHVGWDYQILDENEMRHDAFYAECLPRTGFRYFVAATLKQTTREFAVVAIQRSHRQGHVGRGEIALMRRLLPHLQQALAVGQRLSANRDTHRSLESAFEWLADGVALIRADGTVAYANDSFRAIACCNDGITMRKGAIVIASADARARLDNAIAVVLRLQNGDATSTAVADFPVPRLGGRAPYVVSVRPLMGKSCEYLAEPTAVAVVFVHNPASRNATAFHILLEVLELTEAEAHLAQALQDGVRLEHYARFRGISINTAYAHLRSIKQKTGCHRMGELIRKLNDLRVSARVD
jgi:DNA-binding CsgD family transcriptional regulator